MIWPKLYLKFHQEVDLLPPLSNPYETRPGEKPYKREIIWFNVLIFFYLHAATLYTLGIVELNSRWTYWFSELWMLKSFYYKFILTRISTFFHSFHLWILWVTWHYCRGTSALDSSIIQSQSPTSISFAAGSNMFIPK